jgi:hypothetical protein
VGAAAVVEVVSPPLVSSLERVQPPATSAASRKEARSRVRMVVRCKVVVPRVLVW